MSPTRDRVPGANEALRLVVSSYRFEPLYRVTGDWGRRVDAGRIADIEARPRDRRTAAQPPR